MAGYDLDVLGARAPGLEAATPLEGPIGARDDGGDRHVERTGRLPMSLGVPPPVQRRAEGHDLPDVVGSGRGHLTRSAATDAPADHADRTPVPFSQLVHPLGQKPTYAPGGALRGGEPRGVDGVPEGSEVAAEHRSPAAAAAESSQHEHGIRPPRKKPQSH